MSSYVERIVCLATSKKDGGRCVAGMSISNDDYGRWVRPVSARPTAEIRLEERRFQDGTEPQLLDIINVPMKAHAPRDHQTENHMIDDGEYWEKTGTMDWDDLTNLVDTPPHL